jgi:hypothetical protein
MIRDQLLELRDGLDFVSQMKASELSTSLTTSLPYPRAPVRPPLSAALQKYVLSNYSSQHGVQFITLLVSSINFSMHLLSERAHTEPLDA